MTVTAHPRSSARPARPAVVPARPLLRTALGKVLRETRTGQRRTLADVAETAKISVPYLSEVERGRKEASSEVLAALSEALGVPLSRLLAETGRDLAVALAERDRLERVAAVRELRARTARPARGAAPDTATSTATARGTNPDNAGATAEAESTVVQLRVRTAAPERDVRDARPAVLLAA